MKLSHEQLLSLVRYDQETGLFFWLKDRPNKKIGDLAGQPTSQGYWKLKLLGTFYLAHRAAWLYMNSEWPTKPIDHINGIRNDNSWKNLRQVTSDVNRENQRSCHRDNKSGYLGVSRTHGKNFQARIVVRGKRHHIGMFPTAEEAHHAYVLAKRQLHEGCTL